MAILPNWDDLLNSGLYGLEQYLAWALTETRRLAIANGQESVIKLAIGNRKLSTSEGDRYEGLLRAEVNLSYEPQTALRSGLNLFESLVNVSEEQAILPTYQCAGATDATLQAALLKIADASSGIDTLEKLLY